MSTATPAPLIQRVKTGVEYAAYRALVSSLQTIGPRASQKLGPISKFLGSKTSVLKRADRNIALALPALSPSERREIALDMFDHFGRVVSEFPNLDAFKRTPDLLETEGLEHVEAAQSNGRGVIYVSGHFGSWEAIRAALYLHGWPTALIRRRLNNLAVERHMYGMLDLFDAPQFLKQESSSALPRHLRKGGNVLFLADQRMHGEPSLPFFDRPALTTTAPAKMARLFNCELIPVSARRLGADMRYRVTFEPSLSIEEGEEGILKATKQVNARIEAWARETPGQYFWLHNRWRDAEAPNPD